MKLYFAPMEGLTYPEYRKIHYQTFGGPDAYYSPFFPTGIYDVKFLTRHLPDCTLGIPTVPQLIANRADSFLQTASKISAFGYSEINLNAGCPSGTVFSKHKGSGMLADLNSLDAFLEEVFNDPPCAVSIKTRMGVHSTSEFEQILSVYNRYPVSLLTIHARCRDGMYLSEPDLDGFRIAFSRSLNPVSYNGDISRAGDCVKMQNRIPDLGHIMIGRGAIRNPALFRVIKGGPELSTEELERFCALLTEEYLRSGLGPKIVCERMKNLWTYMISLFDAPESIWKSIRKSKTLEDYQSAVTNLFRHYSLADDA